MAINFPSNPSDNDVYSYNGQNWFWANTAGVWKANTFAIGYTGSRGATGYVGSTGSTGFTGSQGPAGAFGGAAFNYLYSSNTIHNTPANGYLNFNNTTFNSVTTLFLDYIDNLGANSYSFLQTIDDSTSSIKGHFSIKDTANSLNYAMFAITGAHTEDVDHFDIPVSYLSGVTSFTNATNTIVTFARTGDVGDKGYTGSAGSLGYTGSTGIGYTGSQGSSGYTGSTGIGYTGSTGAPGGFITRVNSNTSAGASLSWNSDSFDMYILTAQAANLTFSADSGSPASGQKMIFRIKDNGTAANLTFTTGVSKGFRAVGITLPSITTANKTTYVGCIYNTNDSRWDVIASTTEA